IGARCSAGLAVIRPRTRSKSLASMACLRCSSASGAMGSAGMAASITIVYMHVSEIDTPALVVDLDIMEHNLARVAGYAQEHGLRLRPHTKTHKSVRLARRQIASGAVGDRKRVV